MRPVILLLLLSSIISCGDGIILPPNVTPTPTSTPPVETPSPTPSVSNPLCIGEMGTDGGGGFLWKPKSDPEGATPNRLVVLLPGKFQSRFENVFVRRSSGEEEALRFTGFSNFDQDGLRQTWRGEKMGGAYDGTVLARGGNPFQDCNWKVRNPDKRQD